MMPRLKAISHNTLCPRLHALTAIILGVLFLANCGGTSVKPAITSAQVHPGSQDVIVQTVHVFWASFGTANWSVNGIAGGNSTVGTVTNLGAYTAPAVVPTPNTVTLTATSTADSSQSASVTLTILYSAPLVTSLNPAGIAAGSADTSVTLLGSNFSTVSTVTAGATPLAVTSATSGQLAVTVPATLLANPGVLNLSVATPSPGGGTSAPVTLTVVSTGQVTSTNNVLVAQYSINSPRDGSMVVEFGPDTSYGFQTWSQPAPAGGGVVNMLVAGMKMSSTYHMRAVLTFTDGTQYVDSDKTFNTGTLLATQVPQVTVTNPNGLIPSPGVLMGHLTNFQVPNSSPLTVAALDNQGNLIWYYDTGVLNGAPQPIRLLPNGHFLANLGAEVREIDLAGNIIFKFTPADVTQWLTNAGYNITVNGIHHDIIILPNGHKIILVNSYKSYTGIPGYSSPLNVLGDQLVDLDPNYNVAWVWSCFDHLDINYHPGGLPDWTHSNAIIYEPDDGNLLLSIRSLSWIIKIDYQDGAGTGNVLWHLGYQGDFTISTGQNPDWQYAQHFPIIVSPSTAGNFNLLVYDNGDNRVMDNLGTVCGIAGKLGPQVAGTIPCYTRSVEFQIDEAAKTVTPTWQFNVDPVYSYWGGSNQLLSTGNYVVDINTPTDNISGARYFELTPAQPPEVVLQMELNGQNAYRIIHMPSLYPGVQW